MSHLDAGQLKRARELARNYQRMAKALAVIGDQQQLIPFECRDAYSAVADAGHAIRRDMQRIREQQVLLPDPVRSAP